MDPKSVDLKAISEMLEIINLQLAQSKAARRKALHWLLIALCIAIAAMFAFLAVCGSTYLIWDYSDPETAVAGAALHAFEWLFIRFAPLILIAAVIGAVLTRRKG